MSKNLVHIDPARFPWLDLGRYTFTMAVESGGLVYLSGQTASAYDPETGRVICKGDLLEQTRLVYEKLAVVLEAAGLSFDNVVQTIDYVDAVALPQYRQTSEIRRQYLGDSPVASTGICVHRLLRPDALIEVNAVASTEPKQAIDPGWERYSSLTYAPGVEAGDIVWLSGYIGNEQVDGQRRYPQDTNRQVALCYGIIDHVLKAAGVGPGDVVNTVNYISPRATLQYPDTSDARSGFFQGQYPASTGILVDRLLRPEGHVEIETVAVKGGTRQEMLVDEWERYGQMTFRPGVKKGRLLCLSGQAGVDHQSGQSVGGFDVAAQADQAYQNIARVLAAGGYSMDDVVNTVEWIAPNGLWGYRDVQEVRRKYFGDRFPAATGILAHELLRPELLFEVSAVAVV